MHFEYVVATPVGRRFKCLCPYHQERTASLNINPSIGRFRCFGCGQEGEALEDSERGNGAFVLLTQG